MKKTVEIYYRQCSQCHKYYGWHYKPMNLACPICGGKIINQFGDLCLENFLQLEGREPEGRSEKELIELYSVQYDKHLEELREREVCGYNGEAPYFEVKKEPLYSYKIDQATWNSEEISIKNTHPLFNQIRKRLEKYDKRISLAGATQIEPIIIPSEHPLYLGIKRLLADVEKSVASPCFVIGNLPNFESKKIEYERLGEQA